MRASAFDAITTLSQRIDGALVVDKNLVMQLSTWSILHTAACRELDACRLPAKAANVKTLINTALMRINCLHALDGSIQENALAAQKTLLRALAELEE